MTFRLHRVFTGCTPDLVPRRPARARARHQSATPVVVCGVMQKPTVERQSIASNPLPVSYIGWDVYILCYGKEQRMFIARSFHPQGKGRIAA